MHGTIALPDADRSAFLLRGCAAGDRRAFRELYDMWAARLHGIALRITHQSSLAADATHDAFVQVWQQAGRFDAARGSAEAWLVSLVRYRALDIVRPPELLIVCGRSCVSKRPLQLIKRCKGAAGQP